MYDIFSCENSPPTIAQRSKAFLLAWVLFSYFWSRAKKGLGTTALMCVASWDLLKSQPFYHTYFSPYYCHCCVFQNGAIETRQ